MAIKNVEKKIKKAASKTPSKWKESAKWRRENRIWLNKSFEVALKILETLDDRGWKQKDLAEKMEVSPQQISKILKGKENLSLSTIAKLEEVLQIQLIQVPSFEGRIEFDLVESDIVEMLNNILVGSSNRVLLEDIIGTEFVPEQPDQQGKPTVGGDQGFSLHKLSIAA